MRVSLKYVGVSIVTQFLICISVWLTALLFTSSSLIDLLMYFYWPCLIVAAALFTLIGEKGMIAVPIFGMLGMITYGIVIGILLSFLKKR